MNIFILESESLSEKVSYTVAGIFLIHFVLDNISHFTLVLQLKWMAKLLVANEQGGTLAQLIVDPMQPLQHRTLGAIVVHTAAVFFCRQRVDILQPFVNMLNNPAALVVSGSMNCTPHCDKRFVCMMQQ